MTTIERADANAASFAKDAAETQAALLAEFRRQYPSEDWGQRQLSLFLTWAIIRLVPADLDAPHKAAILALLSTNGAVNASQFQQHYSKEKNGSLLPPPRKTAIANVDLSSF